MRGHVLAVAIAIWCSSCASAPFTRSFQSLPQYITEGSAITVVDTAGARISGRVAALTPTSLQIRVNTALREIPEQDIARIDRPIRHAGRGALIGFGVGLGVGIVGARSARSSGNPLIDTQASSADFAVAIVAGAAIGAGLGALIRSQKTVYVASPPGSATREADAPAQPSSPP